MTQAQRLNEMAGQPVFAERVDECGLPLDGWAVPTFTCQDDKANRCWRLTVGTFRIVIGGGREGIERRWLPGGITEIALLHEGEGLIEKTKENLLRALIDKL